MHKLFKIILGITIIILVFLRLHLSLTRYFDADEFAYMHWAWLLAQGKLPYRDFFFYSTPTFPFLLAPIFLLPAHANLLLFSRLLEFIFVLATGIFTYKISKKIINSFALCLPAVALAKAGLIPFALFLIFPMVLDKTIDIRPDTVMTLTFLIATYLLIKQVTMKRIFWAGFFAGLSVVIFPKIIFALPALGFLLITNRKLKPLVTLNLIQGPLEMLKRHTSRQAGVQHDILIYVIDKTLLKNLVVFCIGFILPILILILYLVRNGILNEFVTAITKYSVIVNNGKLPFNFLTGLSPWPLVYLAHGGVSLPWLVNTAIWILAIPGLFIMLRKHTRMAVFIILYFTGGIVFLYLFPAPYLQYFIPLVPFVSILSVYTLYVISSVARNLLRKEISLPQSGIEMTGIIVILIMTTAILISFFQQYQVRVRAENSNSEQLGVIRDVLKISTPTDTFYDMVGSYVFRPDGYFICCHPYTEFAPSLPVKISSLRESLEKNKTKYLLMDRTGLLFWKPNGDDLNYLQNNFHQSQYPKIYIRK